MDETCVPEREKKKSNITTSYVAFNSNDSLQNKNYCPNYSNDKIDVDNQTQENWQENKKPNGRYNRKLLISQKIM